MRHGPFLARLVFSNEKACRHTTTFKHTYIHFHSFIHSFIHYKHLYSASSSGATQRHSGDTQRRLCIYAYTYTHTCTNTYTHAHTLDFTCPHTSTHNYTRPHTNTPPPFYMCPYCRSEER